jgi:glyoxylase-like metal-dependent hydrolase (beta-lactamase superfamily II)/ferredoxin
MASEAHRLDSNVAGDFFVDDSCIDCGACRWVAADSFDRHGDHSRVYRQPPDHDASARAFQALVACPTGSIGCDAAAAKRGIAGASRGFPVRITDSASDGVYYCGFHSERSFGAASYLIVRPGGNVLVDSPRFNRGLVKRIEELGGVRWMFLTHKDDVAEHRRFRERFGCERVLYSSDVGSDTRDVELQPAGDEVLRLDDDLVVIPTPGHTRGSACLLYRDRFLFSGDHVAWSIQLRQVYAFKRACWYDWDTQIRSMERLLQHRFEHLLPGHGAPCHFEADEMARNMRKCVDWMRASGLSSI